MRYASPPALRDALDQRLRNKSRQSGISLDRLRRRVTENSRSKEYDFRYVPTVMSSVQAVGTRLI